MLAIKEIAYLFTVDFSGGSLSEIFVLPTAIDSDEFSTICLNCCANFSCLYIVARYKQRTDLW